MDFERQLTAQLMLGSTLLTALGLTAGLWRRWRIPGVREWILGFWLVVLGAALLALPKLGEDPLSILVRNEAIICGTAVIALGSARFLGRPFHLVWIGLSAAASIPFLLHWIPRLPDFTGRAGIVSVMVAAWLFWSAWLWLIHGRIPQRGASLFAAALFAGHALFHGARAFHLFLLARPAKATEAGWLQSITYGESTVYLLVLGLMLWVLGNLRNRD